MRIGSLMAGTARAAMLAGAAPRSMPKEVLAFYYGWYGNPEVSGKWNHWKEVDPVKKRSPIRSIGRSWAHATATT